MVGMRGELSVEQTQSLAELISCFVPSVAAAAGHPRGRSAVDRSQCSKRRSQGRLLSASRREYSGLQSSALSSLFTGPAGFWSFAGALAQPIFTGGRIRSGARLSEAREE